VELATPPTTTTVSIPTTFTAAASPPTATLPITYTWEATGLLPVTHTVYSISDTAVFTWNVVGPQMITVTAANECGDGVSMTHTITVTAEVPGWYIYLPLVLSSVEGLVARDLPGAGGYDVARLHCRSDGASTSHHWCCATFPSPTRYLFTGGRGSGWKADTRIHLAPIH